MIKQKADNEKIVYIEVVMYIDPKHHAELAAKMTTLVLRPMAAEGKLHNVMSRHRYVWGEKADIEIFPSGDPKYAERGVIASGDEKDRDDFWTRWDNTKGYFSK